MIFFKKSIIFVFAILLCASIYHDIMSGSISIDKEKSIIITGSPDYDIVKVQALPGETVLSIVEKYNDVTSLDVDQIISDFHKLNVDVHPYHLKANHYYYFPVYMKTEQK